MPFSGPPKFGKDDCYAGPLEFVWAMENHFRCGLSSTLTQTNCRMGVLRLRWGGAKSRGMDTSGQGIFFHFEELNSASDPPTNNGAESPAAKALMSGHVSEAQLLATSL